MSVIALSKLRSFAEDMAHKKAMTPKRLHDGLRIPYESLLSEVAHG